jgi:hypothetical protein
MTTNSDQNKKKVYIPERGIGGRIIEEYVHICGSVHHQSILLNNQRDAALSTRIYSSLRDYTFRVLSAPIIRSTIKTVDAIIGTVHVSVW